MAYDATKDKFKVPADAFGGQARQAVAVTPADSDLATYAKALWVGGGGDVAVVPVLNADDTPIVFKNVPSGSILPVAVRQVRSTSTTATDIVALTS